MASNIDIQKKCEWCGVIFTAHKTSTAYCSHRCANLAYKERVRKKRVQEFQLKFDEEAKPHSEKEFLTPTEVSSFLGVGRTSIYRYIRSGKIKVLRFDGKTLIRRSDIDKMFDYITVCENNKPKDKSPITEFYTTAEIKEKYGVKESWLYKIAKEHNIPAPSIVARPIGVKSTLMPILQRRLPIPILQSGIVWLRSKRNLE